MEIKASRWQKEGVPAFIPDDAEMPHLQCTKKEKIRHKAMAEFIQDSINKSPCTTLITGNTLFDEIEANKLPKWKYIMKQIISETPHFSFTKAIQLRKEEDAQFKLQKVKVKRRDSHKL